MHPSAMFYGKKFFQIYCPAATPASSDFTVIEIGSQNVNGSLREVCPDWVKYIGLDFAMGNGVDIILTDPYQLPLADESADMVVSSSCFEHSQFFWLVILEAFRILKPHGVMYLNVPSNGIFHQYPVDCWRFFPDAGHAMTAWAKRNGYDAMLLESFIGGRSLVWNDFVAIFLKNSQYHTMFPNRIINTLKNFSNGYSSKIILNYDRYMQNEKPVLPE